MKDLNASTLAEIVKHNYKAGEIFEKYSIDYCCCGYQNFLEACKVANADPLQVGQEIRSELKGESDGVNFELWPVDVLVDYITQRHHAYIEKNVPVLKSYLHKICEVHGDQYPELLEVRKIFFELSGELIIHLKQEEFKLFPFIKKLALEKDAREPLASPLFKTVSLPVQMLKDDHAEEGRKLATISKLTNRYRVPDNACSTFSIAYKLLEDFDRNIHIHIHLENNILFPKAIRLEEQRGRRAQLDSR